MAALIKDVYSKQFYQEFSSILEIVLPEFSSRKFSGAVLHRDFKSMEWKQRLKHTTAVLHRFMPPKFETAAAHIIAMVDILKKRGYNSFPYLVLPDYIATYGLADLPSSIKAIEATTQFISCEFAVRPFLITYKEKMLAQMIRWSTHPHYAVRRLASEGSRPRLPWGIGLPAYKKDPSPLIPLLEKLKSDPHEWVRLSVANHLNDISKDHPAAFIAIAQKWKGKSKETDALLKHASRTLLKKADPEILTLFSLSSEGIETSKFKLLTRTVKMGDAIQFSFFIHNTRKEAVKVRLEYGLYYLRSNGTLHKKVFKISERIFEPGESGSVLRKQSFKTITTRVFYPGLHKISIIVNGSEKAVKPFRLLSS